QATCAVNRLDELDRRKIRARFEERFSASRMARDYEGQYRKLVAGDGQA
ncbi:MAG TPA: glycosyltransferase family 4 protein, partial [Bradyrhizobium sp.]|nr:glycosyltransferase family 4 protein [Bradyrhizobium sp.]